MLDFEEKAIYHFDVILSTIFYLPYGGYLWLSDLLGVYFDHADDSISYVQP